MVFEQSSLLLRFGAHVVGEIVGAIWLDNTGYGVFLPAPEKCDDPALRRIREYFAFSENWHEWLRSDLPYSAAEWDAFQDITDSDQWRIVAADGGVVLIGGPVFVQGEITWSRYNS
jgi:hypothetical protein